MGQIWAIAVRDVRAGFGSFIAYVATAFFLALAGFFFFSVLNFSREAQMRNTFNNMGITLLFVIPMITMRSFAEERKTGTLELLATSPLTSVQIVLGKFLGTWLFFLAMVSLTAVYPVILAAVGEPDMRAVAVGYAGFLALGAALLSFGIFTSSLTENQIVAAIVSFGGVLLLWISDWISSALGAVGPVLQYLSYAQHFQNFAKGLVDAVDVFYFLSFAGLFLFLSVVGFETRK